MYEITGTGYELEGEVLGYSIDMAFLVQKRDIDTTISRGYIMTLMDFIQNIHVFNCRSEKKSAFSISIKSNYIVIVGFIVSVLFQYYI